MDESLSRCKEPIARQRGEEELERNLVVTCRVLGAVSKGKGIVKLQKL
jgi:hypothetical protein